VLEAVSAEFRSGWTGITGDNGAGKTTFLMLAAGLLEPQGGSITGQGGVYCPQRTGEPPDLEEFFSASDGDARRIMSILGIAADWPWRWESLSHGERKRLQLGAVLWRQPEILALDEPANHLDREARILVQNALVTYQGIGLLVSHDRVLLDRLCGQCLFLRQGKVVMRPGGVSQGLAEEEREALESRRLRKKLLDERDRLASGVDARRRMVEGSKNRLSKKNLGPRDGDSRGKINRARLTGKDRTGADQFKRMESRLAHLEPVIENTRTPARRKLRITLGVSSAKMDRLCLVPAGKIPLGGGRTLSFPELLVRPDDRIALTGPNGAGKSTLLRFLMNRLPPGLPLLYIPQEIDAETSAAVLEKVRQEEEKDLGGILSCFSRLGSDPGLLLHSVLPSPGEIRKLLIARGVSGSPALIIMDEPTNHLDLRSIRLLEETLCETVCALLLVSHDEAFLSTLTNREWALGLEGFLTIR
jgi:ATPase subunit of ABC transporter with duplicated ATPase domains